jgi:hypothetical protein
MRAPKFIASFVCLLLAFALFQSWMWPWWPEPGWHPSWWQSQTWANLGFPLSIPAMIPVAILDRLGATNGGLELAAVAFGYVCEMGLTYILVYFPTRFLFRRLYDLRAHKAVA